MERDQIINEMSGVSIEFVRRANELFEKVLQVKLEMAESRAFLDGNYVLADILYGYRKGEIRNLVDALKSRGYEMQIQQPNFTTVDIENMQLFMSLEPQQIKLKIYQVVVDI